MITTIALIALAAFAIYDHAALRSVMKQVSEQGNAAFAAIAKQLDSITVNVHGIETKAETDAAKVVADVKKDI